MCSRNGRYDQPTRDSSRWGVCGTLPHTAGSRIFRKSTPPLPVRSESGGDGYCLDVGKKPQFAAE